MWIPKGPTFIGGRRLFEARRLLEEIRYLNFISLLYEKISSFFPSSEKILSKLLSSFCRKVKLLRTGLISKILSLISWSGVCFKNIWFKKYFKKYLYVLYLIFHSFARSSFLLFRLRFSRKYWRMLIFEFFLVWKTWQPCLFVNANRLQILCHCREFNSMVTVITWIVRVTCFLFFWRFSVYLYFYFAQHFLFNPLVLGIH